MVVSLASVTSDCWVGSGLLWTPPSVMFTCVHVLFLRQPPHSDKKPSHKLSTPSVRERYGGSPLLHPDSSRHHTVYASRHKGVASSHGGNTLTFRPPPPFSPPLCSNVDLWLISLPEWEAWLPRGARTIISIYIRLKTLMTPFMRKTDNLTSIIL